jgi:lipopolysaccharide transport system ATP-binding protein
MRNESKAIKVENISKCYRIGLKENMHDTLAKTVFKTIKSPLDNYRRYRSLYKFDDLNPDSDDTRSDIIWALRGISFQVNAGEVVGIIGLNGSGKSTLLKILSKITDPTRGRAEIVGKLSSLLEVGTGFHSELTGRENIYLNGAILGMKKKEIERKFDEIVDFSGVEKFIDTPVKRYSSGMRVRLAFAVAAHLEPDIVLIDEVLAVGDIQFQKKCLNKMQDIGQQGRTVLFVSHNMQAVTRLCSRTILLNNGKLIADGPSHNVVSAYMGSDKSTRAVREWNYPADAPGDEVIKLWAVRIRTEDGLVSEAMDIRKPVYVELEYEVLQPNYVFLVYYHLINSDGLELFETIENDASWMDRPRPVGRYLSTCCIPGNLLSEGILYVSPAIRTLNPEIRRLRVNDAVAFHVIDSLDGDSARGTYMSNLGGVVRPLLKWETHFTKQMKTQSNKIT